MTPDLGTGALWDAIADRSSALLVYCSLKDLRKEEARVGEALSWERLALDVVDAVRSHEHLKSARVIVSAGASGAVLVERDRAWLVFDPANQESDWERRCPGETLGLGTCVVAALGAEAARAPSQPDWLDAIARGLAAARVMHEDGYGVAQQASFAELEFPTAAVAGSRSSGTGIAAFRVLEIPVSRDWRMLSAKLVAEPNLAEQMVRVGPEQACEGVPVEWMGKWASVDRTEIESMRSVGNIVDLNRPGFDGGSMVWFQSTPLGVAVVA